MRPEKYRERFEHTGKNGGPMQVTAEPLELLTPEELEIYLRVTQKAEAFLAPKPDPVSDSVLCAPKAGDVENLIADDGCWVYLLVCGSRSAYGFCQGLDGAAFDDAHSGDTAPEYLAANAIAILHEPSRRGLVRKGFNVAPSARPLGDQSSLREVQ